MKLAIIGSRSFEDYLLLKKTYKKIKGEVDTIVSGGANGADELGQKLAKDLGLKLIIYYPKWKLPDGKTNRGAGMKRNHLIAQEADCVLAFWDGESRGTEQMIDICKNKYEKPTHVVKFEGE